MSKFLTSERKNHYSWLIAIVLTIIIAWNIGTPIFFGMFFQLFVTFFVMILIDQVHTNDLLRRFSMIYFLPTVILYWIFMLIFHIDEVISTLWNWVKILLCID